jgi:hypothetical protein
MAARKPKRITDKNDIEYILSLDEDTITSSKIMEMFGKYDNKQRFNPYDEFEVPAGVYGPNGKKNKNKFVTTVGIWIFNRLFIERDLFHLFGYINKTIDAGMVDDINIKLSHALMEDDIDTDVMDRYIMKQQMVMTYISVLTPNHTLDMLTATKKINAKKAELNKKYAKEIAAGDTLTMDRMEKELLDYAAEVLKDDPGMDMYRSGARGSFKNNFKNMFVMKGLVKSPDPTQGYNFVQSSYMDGVDKEDYVVLSNALIEGPYKRGKKTELGGAWEKLAMAALQHLHIGKEGSDCGTTKYIEVTLDKKNVNDWMYNYIIDGSKLVELTSKNQDKYIGKKVKFRFSQFCENKDGGVICHRCAGNMWYRLGITNIGATTPQLFSIIKLKSMKAFHDSTVKYREIDPMKVFGLK